MNLLSNASYATERHPHPYISIEVSEEEDWVTLKVKNTADPIPDAIRSRLFKDYYSSKPKGEGTGFGLMICKKIIESMNGLICLSPRTDLVEFAISLPRLNSVDDTRRSSRDPSAA